MIMVRSDEKPEDFEVFTVLRNSAHFNVSSLFEEDKNRDHANDSLTLVQGFLGSYPDVFWQVNASDIPQVVKQLGEVKDESDYQHLLDKVGVRRTNPEFWSFSDELIRWSEARYPVDGGLLDYNRLEDR